MGPIVPCQRVHPLSNWFLVSVSFCVWLVASTIFTLKKKNPSYLLQHHRVRSPCKE